MAKKKHTMTKSDRAILASYETIVDGLAAYFGPAFEIVLHDLIDLDHSIIKIANGHHSGRKEGAPITDFALSLLEQIKKNKAAPFITYTSAGKYGKPVSSTTIVIFGTRRHPIGMLCINLYLDSPISALLQNFAGVTPTVTETFMSDSADLVRTSLEKAKLQVTADDGVPVSQKNKEIILALYYHGIFKLKDAVQTIADDLGISKNTVYLHNRSVKDK
jgi:predicted transcriptional regulator YheO